MFTDWCVLNNFCTKTGIQAKCANCHLIKASGVGDVVLMINDFVEGILATSGRNGYIWSSVLSTVRSRFRLLSRQRLALIN